MDAWVKVVTAPLGLVGFGLLLVFGLLANVKGRNERRWISRVAVAAAVVVLIGGLVLAYLQSARPSAPAVETSATPTSVLPATVPPPPPPSQTSTQSTTGSGSPAVQGVQGNVKITVDQSGKIASTPSPSGHQPTAEVPRRPSRAPASVEPGNAAAPAPERPKNDAGAKGEKPRENVAFKSIKEFGVETYDPPGTMVVATPVNIDVAIRRPGGAEIPFVPSATVAKDELGLTGSGPLQSQQVPVGDIMDVQLRSAEADAFTITPLDANEKSLQVGGHAEWHWTVTPLQAGTRHLLLHSQIIRTQADGTRLPPDDLGTESATITVSVLPWYQRAGSATGQLLGDNWKSVLAYLLPGGAGAAWLAAWWKRRKEKKAGIPVTEDAPAEKPKQASQ